MTEARNRWTEVPDRVVEGEEVIITRFGRPVAVIVTPEALARRRVGDAIDQANRLRDLLDLARTSSSSSGPSPSRAADLAARLRGDRDTSMGADGFEP